MKKRAVGGFGGGFNAFNQNNYDDEPEIAKPKEEIEPERPPRSCFRIAIQGSQ